MANKYQIWGNTRLAVTRYSRQTTLEATHFIQSRDKIPPPPPPPAKTGLRQVTDWPHNCLSGSLNQLNLSALLSAGIKVWVVITETARAIIGYLSQSANEPDSTTQ